MKGEKKEFDGNVKAGADYKGAGKRVGEMPRLPYLLNECLGEEDFGLGVVQNSKGKNQKKKRKEGLESEGIRLGESHNHENRGRWRVVGKMDLAGNSQEEKVQKK